MLAVITLVCAVSAATLIEQLEVYDIKVPVAGDHPDTTLSSRSNTQGKGYKLISVKWKDETAGTAIGNAFTYTYVGGHVYSVTVQYAANDGYAFLTDKSNKLSRLAVTLNGQSVAVKAPEGYSVFERVEFSYTFPAAEIPHEHTPSEWRFMGDWHYRACTSCGDMLEQQDHTGGTATCEKLAVCTVCKREYGRLAECRYSTEWQSKAALGHAHTCTVCGGYVTLEAHLPGPEATETAPQVCVDCGYIIAPAKGHKHSLTLKEAKAATCMEAGNSAYYTCNGCSGIFEDKDASKRIEQNSVIIAPLGHLVSDKFTYDNEFHWRTCTRCSAVLEETKLVHSAKTGKCPDCGYDADAAVTAAATGAPEKDTDAPQSTAADTKKSSADDWEIDRSDKDEGFKLSWTFVVIAGIVIFGASLTVTVILIKNKKK